MSDLRLGVIGCGGRAQGQMKSFAGIEGLNFVAGADPIAASRQAIEQAYGIRTYEDGMAMLDSGGVDAVLIATPHYLHPAYMIAAFERGIHVLTEKPVAVTAKAAEQMNTVAEAHPDLVYAAMFQMRANPRWKEVKRLIDTGEVGELQRASWTVTTWFRSHAYYRSGDWRATWKGEGGGVLLNQCPHQLDLFTWLVGSPSQVTAIIGLGKYHEIEVEDDVTAMLSYPNGATGTFVTSTGEAPGINRLEIVGERGTLIVEEGSPIELIRNQIPAGEFSRTTRKLLGGPPSVRYTIQPDGPNPDDKFVVENFIRAVRNGEPLIAPGAEGIHSLELGNAMLMSGLTHQSVNLPTDRDAFDQLLQNLISKGHCSDQAALRIEKRECVLKESDAESVNDSEINCSSETARIIPDRQRAAPRQVCIIHSEPDQK